MFRERAGIDDHLRFRYNENTPLIRIPYVVKRPYCRRPLHASAFVTRLWQREWRISEPYLVGSWW